MGSDTRIQLSRAFDRCLLGRFDRARSIRAVPSYGIIALWATFNVDLPSRHGMGSARGLEKKATVEI